MCICGKTGPNRRRLLTGMAALAAFGAMRPAAAMTPPSSLHRVSGAVTVNGKPAGVGTPIANGDMVTAGAEAEAVFTLGDDGFLLRAQGAVSITDRQGERQVDLESGRLLSVFGPKVITLRTPHANVGIRGTAAYLEAHSASTNICVCYGHAVMVPKAAPDRAEEVRTRHHDAPRQFFPAGHDPVMEPYKVINHTDEELVMLEALLGRVPPFMAK
ncbi:hypothetical protein CCC_00681 [Paramagnetospirillum magnetotacticum MS-1]|uniref:Uncharacterized protein n=1 Tax=Paramagnetospirillum magnetotacticum MS-1 TaxID=272627 RepID=A0A0C2YSE9_PARME|nr:hypothetical protein [Paramagnetospirillum magnetotacticum]KIL97620.1 hypothetical protein CCC_00681 [Paramagnetospirillum magnetotacticum MS-1]